MGVSSKISCSLHRTVQLQVLSVTGWGIALDYRDIEWFALETNRDPSVIFEIASKYCILDSFVDHDGRDITLSTKVHLVKAMVFPVVMYGCESWTVKKAECRRIDAVELWC